MLLRPLYDDADETNINIRYRVDTAPVLTSTCINAYVYTFRRNTQQTNSVTSQGWWHLIAPQQRHWPAWSLKWWSLRLCIINAFFTTKSLRQAEYFTSRLEWLRFCGKIFNAPKWHVIIGDCRLAPPGPVRQITQHSLPGVSKFSPDVFVAYILFEIIMIRYTANLQQLLAISRTLTVIHSQSTESHKASHTH